MQRRDAGLGQMPRGVFGHGRLKGAADQHGFRDFRQPDQRCARAPLRQDFHQPLGGEASKSLRDRKPGHAEAVADQGLVDEFSGLELQPHHGCTQNLLDPIGRVPARAPFENRKETVHLPFAYRSRHSSMLVELTVRCYRVAHIWSIRQDVRPHPLRRSKRRIPVPLRENRFRSVGRPTSTAEVSRSSLMNTPRTIRLHADDNIAVAIDLVNQGDTAAGLTARERILRGHKMAVEPIREGEPIRKFGQIIGFASAAYRSRRMGARAQCRAARIRARLPVLRGCQRRRSPAGRAARHVPGLSPRQRQDRHPQLSRHPHFGELFRFGGPLRGERSRALGLLADYPDIDGVVAFVHGTGCGHAAYGEGFEVLRRTQWGYAGHPNFAGVVMVGLGCEVFQIGRMKKEYGLEETDTFRTMTIQETGGTRKTVDAIVSSIRDMLPIAGRAKRETRPASELILALQCGGSDGYSGITANPALGAASDLLVRHGGTSILSETPEIYGAEHLLTRRAATRAIGEKLVERIRWWEDYTERNGGEMNNNPSPGNKAGGLTTILEKSLGAAAKGGTTPLRAVYEYAEQVKEHGFVFMDTPGYDPVAATGQVAGGANLIVFTTGRGSAFGASPRPRSSSRRTPTCIAGCRTTWTSIAATFSTACRSRTRARRSSRRC